MRRLALVSLFAACTAIDATAAPVLFTDRATWEAAAGTIQTIDFEGIADDGVAVSFNGPSGLNLGGVHFESYGNTSYLLVVDDDFVNPACIYPCYGGGTGDLLHGSPFAYGSVGNPAGIEATFSGTSAMGTDIWTILPDQASGFEVRVIVTVDGMTEHTYFINTPAGGPSHRGFVGFISDETLPITAVRFEALPVPGADQYGPYLDLDSFAVAVPEPSSLLLLGSGLVAAGALSRRRRSSR